MMIYIAPFFYLVKVYASWCKTCQVFDVRYRKLASQLGDKQYDPMGSQPKPTPVPAVPAPLAPEQRKRVFGAREVSPIGDEGRAPNP